MKTTTRYNAGNWSILVQLTILAIGCFAVGGTSAQAADYERNLEKTYTVASGGKLVLQADRGSIEIVTDATDQVRIQVFRRVKGGTQAQAEALFANHEVAFAHEGNTVTILAKSKESRRFFSGFRQPYIEVRYQVNLPKQFDVDLVTAGGDVHVGDLDGQVAARTSSGSIQLARVAGKVQASDSGGDISIAQAGGAVVARTSSGSITVRQAGGKIEVSNSGGDILIGAAGDAVTASTSSGGITVASAKGGVDLRNAGGDIKIEAAEGEVNAQTSSGTIHIGSVKGQHVKVRNSGGDIDIGEVEGSVSAETSSGNVRVKSAGAKVSVRNSGGDIFIGEAGDAVNARTSSGTINIKTARGDVEAGDSGGDITVHQVDGDCRVQTSSGSIRIGLAKGRVEARDSGGDIQVGEARNGVQANTSSGTMTVSFGAVPKTECRLEVTGGGLTVGLPRAAAVDLDAKASGGKVVIEKPMKVEVQGEQKRGELVGQVGGGGPALRLRSSSGDIRLRESPVSAVEAEDPAP